MTILDEKLRNSYGCEAVRYDERRFMHRSGQLYEGLANKAIRTIIQEHFKELSPDELHLVDVATGTGRAALDLTQRGSQVVALDLTEEMLRRGLAKAEQQELKDRINFIIANARYLPFKKRVFDGAISLRFFHLFPPAEHKVFLREITRVVKPGGIVIIEFNNRFPELIWFYLSGFHRANFVGKKTQPSPWPHQIDQKFTDLAIIKKWGIWLPGTGKILRLSETLARFVNRLTGYPPFCYLANQILIAARV